MAERPARITVRVSPGTSRSTIVGRYGDAWKVAVAAPAERGRANAAVVSLLAAALAVPERDVRLVIGHAARDKVIEVSGMSAVEADRLLAAWQRKGDG